MMGYSTSLAVEDVELNVMLQIETCPDRAMMKEDESSAIETGGSSFEMGSRSSAEEICIEDEMLRVTLE